ncbi:unnamed protein product [Taenia asiatica]|uniref:RRM domain-containing protein n=1 Tax=Taenia asiatica TaxID=60517 RepID=A0A0R3WD08_TAEAS|nr:unnamed protein product [Taenia asiatica]
MLSGAVLRKPKLSLHIPYTLPCEHSYCLEPCLIVRSNQTEVRCFRCKKLYPFNKAVRNAVLERRIAQCFVEERQNLVATCTACQHPAPALCECQHCEVRICSACRDSHAAKVVTSVTKSTYALLQNKKDLEEIRNSLKIMFRIQATHLRNLIERATLELEGACNRLLDRSTAKLNDLFDAHQAELNTSKGAICNMKEITRKYLQQEEFVPKMALGPLLAMKKVLEGVATLTKCIHDGVDECEKRFNLCVDYSLSGVVKNLSLIDTAGQDDNNQDDRKKVDSNDVKSAHQLVVDGLPLLARVNDIRDIFGQFGAITKVTLGQRMDSALVTFSTTGAVQKVMMAAPIRLKGAHLRVSLPENHEISLNIPYTLPCEHSYCLEPCLIARPNQTEVRCLRCNQLYPLDLAMRNANLERRVIRRFVEERRRIVVTCGACQHPAPFLRSCQHCDARICSRCRDLHAAKVATSVTKSTYALLQKKKYLEEVRNSLKMRSCSQATHLRNCIEQVTLELKEACNRLLDRSAAKLDDLFDARQAELNASKVVIDKVKETIEEHTPQTESIPQLVIVKTTESSAMLPSLHRSLSAMSRQRQILRSLGNTFRYSTVKKSFYSRRRRYAYVALESEKPLLRVISRRMPHVCGTRVKVDAMRASCISLLLAMAFKLAGDNLRVSSRQGAPKSQLSETASTCCDPKSFSPPAPALQPSPALASPPEGRPKVFVRGISWKTTVISLQVALSKLGPVQEIDVHPTRGFAIVEFRRHETAKLAIFTLWHTIDGKLVEIRPFIPKMKAERSSGKSESL